MTKQELIEELEKLGVIDSSYSLNEGLKSNASILEDLDGLWKYFYFDEKGQESDTYYFKTESDAYLYLLNKYKNDLKRSGKEKYTKDDYFFN